MALFSVVSCALLPRYLQATVLSCNMTLERLRFPMLFSRMRVERALPVVISLWSYSKAVECSGQLPSRAASYNAQHRGSYQSRRSMIHLSDHPSQSNGRAQVHVVRSCRQCVSQFFCGWVLGESAKHKCRSMTLTVWFVAVVTAAGPSSLYAAVKAVPGLLHISGVWEWILSQSVALITALLTSFGLPWLARLLHKAQ
eukprot:385297-Amphidinium_carterae.1